MSDKQFYDTNILVYAYDIDEGEKSVICKKLVDDVFSGKVKGYISNQILGELFWTLTRKLKLLPSLASGILYDYVDSDNWIKIDYTSKTTLKASVSMHVLNTASFWDTVIAETMKENGIQDIITENTGDFKKMPGIQVRNPFK